VLNVDNRSCSNTIGITINIEILYIILPSVRLCALRSPLTLYPATDCAAATDISGVTGCWQLNR